MGIRQIRSILLLAALVAVATPAGATDTYTYGKDEYAIIRAGLSRDRQLSLAAHGDGDGAGENFRIWLMAEPQHRRIVALPGIGDANVLDTGPNAYAADWSADSRRVAVYFRSDRRIGELFLYAVEDRKPALVSGPTLFREIAGRDVNEDDDLRRSIRRMSWRGPDRFVLTEQRLFLTRDAGFAGRLGRYAGVTDRLDDGRLAVEFSAEADCVISRGRYRIVNIRVGKFDDAKR